MATEARPRPPSLAIVGTAGLPAAYGGFETLAENLVLYAERAHPGLDLAVFCSGRAPAPGVQRFHGARLRYLPLSANGVASIPYDLWSLALAAWSRTDAVLVLGVSGAVALPLVRCFTRMRIVTNIDGIEWRRAKWGRAARAFLRLSEWLAVRCSHVVVADNQGVADHVAQHYGAACTVIAYGGDHAVDAPSRPYPVPLPPRYALALCRIEPENNVDLVLEAFANAPALPLVFVGNWEASAYGRALRARYQDAPHLRLLDPEYGAGALKTLRAGASLYVHGHSAGGTNPSLVEMMHFGVPVAAFDCVFNRCTTHGQAWYFSSAAQLAAVVAAVVAGSASGDGQAVGARMQALARQHYTWERVGAAYFEVLAGQS